MKEKTVMGMNSMNRKLGMTLLAVALICSAGCNCDINKKKDLLIGDWIRMGEQWPPGFRFTQDSISPLLEDSGFLSAREHLGEPYKLTKNDSLIFGPTDDNVKLWGLKKALTGSWKIIKLTEDSLTVQDDKGIMNFYKKSK